VTSRRRSRSDTTLPLPHIVPVVVRRGRMRFDLYGAARELDGCKASARPCRIDLSGCLLTPCSLRIQADLRGGYPLQPGAMCPRCHALVEANLQTLEHRAKRLGFPTFRWFK
jgi:hypothetical protein